MKLKALLFLASIFLVFSSNAQKLSVKFNPVISEASNYVKIIEHQENEFLVYGGFEYFEKEYRPYILKIDSKGSIVEGFEKVYLDQPVTKSEVLETGKILINGQFKKLNGVETGDLVRLNADGTLDHSFKINESFRVGNFSAQSTGKVIILYSTDGSEDMKLGRINTDGSLDNTFSSNLNLHLLSNLTMTVDDEILITTNQGLLKLGKDGENDPLFNFQQLEPNARIESCKAVEDGILLSISYFYNVFPYVDYKLVKLNEDGVADNLFQVNSADRRITNIVVRNNGNILVAGDFTSFGGVDGTIIEMFSDGTIKGSVQKLNVSYLDGIIEDSSNNIYVTGRFTFDDSSKPQIIKINKDYTLDNSYKVPVSTTGRYVNAKIAAQKDGKLLFGGDYNTIGFGEKYQRFFRFHLDGSVDSSFKPSIISNYVSISAIAIQEDNKILIGGFDSLLVSASSSFGRLLPDGSIDHSFNIGKGPKNKDGSPVDIYSIRIHNKRIIVVGRFDLFNNIPSPGIVILDLNGNPIVTFDESIPKLILILDMEIQSDGKVVLMGFFQFKDPSIQNRLLIRINEDGSLDNSFAPSFVGNLFDLEIDSTGNIYIVGNSINGENRPIAKLTSSGEIDTSFKVSEKFAQNSDFTTLYSIKCLPKGNFIIGGSFNKYSDTLIPGVVYITNEGTLLPFENPFDLSSYSFLSEYANNSIYMFGKFSKNSYRETTSGIKIVFPIENSITAFKATALSDSKMNISWNGQLKGADIVEIEQKKSSGNFEVIATIPNDSNSIIVEGLEEATIYHYSIMGYNEFYSSVCVHGSDTTFIKPQIALAPTDITYSSFVANWEYLPGTDSCLLQVSKDNFATFTASVLKEGSLLVEVDDSDASYKYRVQRFRSGMVSNFSEEIEVELLVLGIEERNPKLKIYPNPSQDYIYISGAMDLQVNLHSANGTLIRKEKLSSPNYHRVDIRSLPVGVFILTLTDLNNRVNRYKLIKEN